MPWGFVSATRKHQAEARLSRTASPPAQSHWHRANRLPGLKGAGSAELSRRRTCVPGPLTWEDVPEPERGIEPLTYALRVRCSAG